MKTTSTLYRPVGQTELDLIAATDMRAFPPRLPEQPIFYPVLDLEYAREIARDWNAVDPVSGYVGYVTRFEVRRDFLANHAVKIAGARRHREYWIPAEALDDFNAAIVGRIEIIETWGAGRPPAS